MNQCVHDRPGGVSVSGEIGAIRNIGDVRILRGNAADQQESRRDIGVGGIPGQALRRNHLLRFQYQLRFDVKRVIDRLRCREEPLHLFENSASRAGDVNADVLDVVSSAQIADGAGLKFPGAVP